MTKITWHTDQAPTGRYRSFQNRGWPHAENERGDWIFDVRCDDEYVPAKVKTGDHKPLTLRFAKYHTDPEVVKAKGGFTWMRYTRTFNTLAELKEFAKERLTSSS